MGVGVDEMDLNSNTHFQRGRWEQGRSPVGGDCYHTILNFIFTIKLYIYYLLEVGAMAIAPYGCFKNQKHYNLHQRAFPRYTHGTYFLQKLFFNVKILRMI